MKIRVWFFALFIPLASFANTECKPNQVTLRKLADQRHFQVGTAVSTDHLEDDPAYAAIIANEYNFITPENEMKFKWTEPSRSEFNFKKADRMLQFAQKHDIHVRGHNLAWCHGLPDWLTKSKFSPQELKVILKNHIQTEVGHFKAQFPHRVVAWDVVNEALEKDGTFKACPWSEIGNEPSDYVEYAFLWAHEADPEAKLYYNEYGAEGMGKKSNAVYQLVKKLKDQKIPIDGVGFQMHFGEVEPSLDLDDFQKNMQRLSALGVEVSITEADFALRDQPTSTEQLSKQANFFHDFLAACLKQASCKNFTVWGFTDKYSWIPEFEKGLGRATPFDQNLKVKPAYCAIRDTLKNYK